MQQLRTVRLDELVKCADSESMEEEKYESMRTVLNMSSNHCAEVLADLVKYRLLKQGCAQFLRSIHQFVSRSGFVAAWYALCLEYSVY